MKTTFFIAILAIVGFAGEIKTEFETINKIENMDARIEKKLDLILSQYIKKEKEAEDQKAAINNAIEKTKRGIKSGASWITDKTQEILDKNK